MARVACNVSGSARNSAAQTPGFAGTSTVIHSFLACRGFTLVGSSVLTLSVQLQVQFLSANTVAPTATLEVTKYKSGIALDSNVFLSHFNALFVSYS
jgi:hypothetical protein